MTERLACLRAEEAGESAREALAELARSFSPRVELRSDVEICLDLGRRTKTGQLLQAAEGAGLRVSLGVATRPTVAWLASRVTPLGQALEVAPGDERRFLSPLPLEMLRGTAWLDEGLWAALQRFGLQRMGQLAGLPDRGLARRLGPGGLRLRRLVRGDEPLAWMAHRPVEVLFEDQALDWEVAHLDALRMFWAPMLDRLAARLDERGLNATALHLRLGLAAGAEDRRRLLLAQPSRRAPLWAEQIGRELERRPPSAPVDALRIEAQVEAVRPGQVELFVPGPRPSRRLDETLAALQPLVLDGPLGSPRVSDSHRPEDFHLAAFAPNPSSEAPPAQAPGVLPLRLLRPARPVRVDPGRGLPARVQCQAPGLSGRVRRAAGPYRLDAEWWAAVPLKRDYYDVELEGGLLLRLYREGDAGRWWVDGILG